MAELSPLAITRQLNSLKYKDFQGKRVVKTTTIQPSAF
jgi:hypothetical protein